MAFAAPTLGKVLGFGCFGEVCLADCPVHKDVAVKIIRRPAGLTDQVWDERKASLVAEASSLKTATHPHVVQVYYVRHEPADDTLWLVMERCDRSLQHDYEVGPMPLGDVRQAVSGACQGLSVLHARGLLHRDLKPANILWKGKEAVLSDFGLVTDDLVLGYGSAQGYSDHVAPEVWAGSGTSVRSDIWAMGMTVYRLLHGSQWYGMWHSGANRPANDVRRRGFASRLKWLPHIPVGWRRFVRKALHDDPHRRFQSADEMLNALAHLAVTPSWEVSVGPTSVAWTRKRADRILEVTWSRNPLRAQSWTSSSRPASGTGGRNRLRGSGAQLSEAHAVAQLETHFAELR